MAATVSATARRREEAPIKWQSKEGGDVTAAEAWGTDEDGHAPSRTSTTPVMVERGEAAASSSSSPFAASLENQAVAGAPTPPLAPQPTLRKRESLRAFAPLIRHYSQELKNSSPWAVALNSTRTKEKRQAIARFNQKASAGLDMLYASGLLKREPADVANFLRQNAAELSKKRIGEYCGSPDPFAQEVLHQLLQQYEFDGMAIDEAMRVLINDIRFPGEAQMLDRVLNAFARRYHQANPDAFATEDTVYILTFSLMLLNTDLHNRNLQPKEKMRLEDFIRNNRGINDGRDLPRELLAGGWMDAVIYIEIFICLLSHQPIIHPPTHPPT